MLELRNVVKTYAKNVKAVGDVSLQLSAGVVGLIGHNGAGIARTPNAIRRRVGFLPQDSATIRT